MVQSARINKNVVCRIPGSLSTNAAIFASVLLASRFDTNLDVFSLLSFAVEWFALFPIFRRYLQVCTIVNIPGKRACDSFSPLLGHESQSSNHVDHSHASHLCRHVHSHIQSSRFLIHPQFLFYYLHMSLVVDLHSKVQKVSLLGGWDGWDAYYRSSCSEIHGPWDEARPRLQRSRKNVYRKRSS